jgi:hypothetical protein
MLSRLAPNHAVLVTAARWRMLLNVKGRVRAAARDGERYCDTRSQVCTTERQHERMIQS